MNIDRPFAVVANDAGGANQIVSFLHELEFVPDLVISSGPAHNILKSAFPNAEYSLELRSLSSIRCTITGTSAFSSLEHYARQYARRLNIYCIAVLDHWVNYPSRFMRNGRQVLPDELWVFDSYAFDYAKKSFPGTPVRLQSNSYMNMQVSKITSLPKANCANLLYILEPIQTRWFGELEPEFQALNYFFSVLEKSSFCHPKSITLRPHPSEDPHKYLKYCNQENSVPVSMSAGSLSHDIAQSEFVVGCHSYAMVIALMAGKTVFSSLPPTAPNYNLLPHDDIIYLRELNI